MKNQDYSSDSEFAGDRNYRIDILHKSQFEVPVIRKSIAREDSSKKKIKKLQNEYELTRNLSVSGVRKAFEFVKDEDNGYQLVLEYIPGQTLYDYVAQNRTDLSELLSLYLKILRIIGDIHKFNIVHKNITSQHILISSENKDVFLIDFGLASAFNFRNPYDENLEGLEGNVYFISPEQTNRLNRRVDYRSDFYSLGIVFYETLTGRVPFDSSDPLEVIHGHLAKPVVLPGRTLVTVPNVIKQIIIKLLAKNPEDRYQSIMGIEYDLNRCLDLLKGGRPLADFEIAERDFGEKLNIPDKLYGRKQQIDLLKNQFNQVKEGGKKFVYVAGISGVGKSSLVYEIRKSVISAKGYFISGKFDQLHGIPYQAIIEAFSEFIKILLSESPERLRDWKEKILNAVGSAGKILIDIIPDLQLIIGPQPELPLIQGKEAQNRFKYVFRSFVKTISDKNHPLVLFADDLQWSDSESLDLIHFLLNDKEIHYLLLLTAFRNNEVTPTHRVSLTLNQLKADGVAIESIVIENLTDSDVMEIVEDSLNPLPTSEAKDLQRLITDKTSGNAFFVKEYLQHLFDEGLIRLHQSGSGTDIEFNWKWHPEELEKAGISENMVDLIKANILGLSADTQNVLKLASAIGNRFRLSMVSIISEQNSEVTFKALQDSLGKSIIIPVDPSNPGFDLNNEETEYSEFKFVHDWVQSAVYELIDQDEKINFHYKIGKILLSNYLSGSAEASIFDIVNQLNLSESVIKNIDERVQLAKLNLRAAKEAKKASAFHQAFDFVNKSISLLDEQCWHTQYDLSLMVFSEGSDIAYKIHQFEKMHQFIEKVVKNAHSIFDCENTYLIKMHYYNSTGQADKAIDTGLWLLKELNINIPSRPGRFRLVMEFIRSKIVLANKSTETLSNLPLMSSPEILFATRILSVIGSAAYMTAPELTAFIGIKSVILNVKYGNTENSPYNFAGYGLVLVGVVNDIDRGYKFGKLSEQLLHDLERKTSLSKTLVVIHGFISFWKESIRNTLKPLLQAHIVGLETGDPEYATNALGMRNYYTYFSAVPLQDLISDIDKFLELIIKLKQEISVQWHQILLQSLNNLATKVANPVILQSEQYDEYIMLPAHEKVGNKSLLFTFYFNKAILGFLFHDTERALFNIDKTNLYSNALIASYFIPLFHCYQSLIYLSAYRKGLISKGKAFKSVNKSMTLLKGWTSKAAMNFENKYFLLKAYRHEILGDFNKALKYFEKSIESSQINGFIQEKALAQELASEACMNKGYSQLAKHFMLDAIQSNIQWGAFNKSEFLKVKYSTWIEEKGKSELNSKPLIENDLAHVNLDLSTIIKASMTLSKEVDLKNLVQKIMEFAMENAGAERAFFILKNENENELMLLARSEPSKNIYDYKMDVPLETVHDLARTIIYYTSRTGKTILLSDAAQEEQFKNDSYISQSKPKSILCAPIGNKGEVSAIIYMENNQSSGAFLPSRLRILNLLSGQAAISIENATLYKKLESNLDQQVELIKAYQRFMPHEFLQTLGYNSILDVSLGDQVEKEVTVFFSDIRSYTSLSEKMSPVENFEYLNQFFKKIRPIIESNNGFIANLYGDGYMALFTYDPEDAIRAAIDIQMAVKKFNDEMHIEGIGNTRVGIGINTGKLMLGVIGDEYRMSPGVVSDTVNLTSRIEGLTKIFGASIIVGKDTLQKISNNEKYANRFLGNVKVLGKDDLVSVYELFDGINTNMDQKSLSLFKNALDHYLNRNFLDSIAIFEELIKKYPRDLVSARYLKNASELIVRGIPPDWTGNEIIDQK